MKHKQTFLFLLVFLLFASTATAQPFTLDDRIQPVELMFEEYKKDDEKTKGRISNKAFLQESDTAYYWAKGFSMFSPIFFNITASNDATDIEVKLCKENWKQFHQSGAVKGKGKWNTNFKTEGDFGIMVIAKKKPVRYALLIWNGAEVKVDIPSPFKTGTVAATGGGWFKENMTLVLVAVVALAIIGFLLFKLKKNKK